MPVFLENPYNPNPISKCLVTILLGLTLTFPLSPLGQWTVVLFLAFLFYKNGLLKDAVKTPLVFAVLFSMPKVQFIENAPAPLRMFIMLFLVYRMFYLPLTAGKLLIKTSDVGSIISSMVVLRFPRAVSIPIAVMFRFFPSFKEEKQHIQMAMKIRGIGFQNPLRYIEYVTVPLLVLTSNIADDIAKAAETKCIDNPVQKSHYVSIHLQWVDFLYVGIVLLIMIGGRLW